MPEPLPLSLKVISIVMSDKISQLKSWFKDKILAVAGSAQAKWWLAGIAFAESSFFFLPPDPFLMAVVIASRSSWFLYSLWTMLFSVLGGVFGYFIGFVFFDLIGRLIIEFYGLESEFLQIEEMFLATAFGTIFVSAFSPIPYIAFTIAGGFFGINLVTFILASLLGRGLRYLTIGYLTHLFGRKMSRLVYHYFNLTSLVIGGLILLFIIIFYILG